MSVDAGRVAGIRKRGGPSFTSILGILFLAFIAIVLLRNLINDPSQFFSISVIGLTTG